MHLDQHQLVGRLDNAVKFSPSQTSIVMAARVIDDHWQLSVEDAGPGIPLGQREQVSERLYRLDTSRSTPGLGLGLSLVKAIATLHRGVVTISDGSVGAKVLVSLPMSRQ